VLCSCWQQRVREAIIGNTTLPCIQSFTLQCTSTYVKEHFVSCSYCTAQCPSKFRAFSFLIWSPSQPRSRSHDGVSGNETCSLVPSGSLASFPGLQSPRKVIEGLGTRLQAPPQKQCQQFILIIEHPPENLHPSLVSRLLPRKWVPFSLGTRVGWMFSGMF